MVWLGVHVMASELRDMDDSVAALSRELAVSRYWGLGHSVHIMASELRDMDDSVAALSRELAVSD
mgnify:CR=1 FL=1